mmetsp:Transcript_18931/g.45626  ORF Transcript_18931/g.45626 Transcript_18931/m.45626 type:complete len:225 (-) Transcript_18931:1444-2118(-)
MLLEAIPGTDPKLCICDAILAWMAAMRCAFAMASLLTREGSSVDATSITSGACALPHLDLRFLGASSTTSATPSAAPSGAASVGAASSAGGAGGGVGAALGGADASGEGLENILPNTALSFESCWRCLMLTSWSCFCAALFSGSTVNTCFKSLVAGSSWLSAWYVFPRRKRALMLFGLISRALLHCAMHSSGCACLSAQAAWLRWQVVLRSLTHSPSSPSPISY